MVYAHRHHAAEQPFRAGFRALAGRTGTRQRARPVLAVRRKAQRAGHHNHFRPRGRPPAGGQHLGGIMGSSGGSSTTTTVQKADPWSGQQPYLRDVFSQAKPDGLHRLQMA